MDTRLHLWLCEEAALDQCDTVLDNLIDFSQMQSDTLTGFFTRNFPLAFAMLLSPKQQPESPLWLIATLMTKEQQSVPKSQRSPVVTAAKSRTQTKSRIGSSLLKFTSRNFPERT
jgi:hypothetical protein